MTEKSDRVAGTQGIGMGSSNGLADVPGGGIYDIRVKGYIDEHWSEWLGHLRVLYDAAGNTHLVGTIPDQAALHGIFLQIRDLGLTLITMARLEPDPDKTQDE